MRAGPFPHPSSADIQAVANPVRQSSKAGSDSAPCCAASCARPVVPYWQSLGLKLKDVFLLQGIFGGTLILFDAPAGYVADLCGRKKVLIIGSLVSALGFQVLWFGRTFFDFALMEVLMGLGLIMEDRGGLEISRGV